MVVDLAPVSPRSAMRARSASLCGMSDQCVFCDIVAGELPSVTVAENDATYAFMDIHPATAGHLLVVPKRHSRDLFDIPADDLSAVTLAAQRIARVTVAQLGADGVNLL